MSMLNKHHTEETKKKISEARKGKYIGKNHPMYGVHRFGKDSPNWKGGISNNMAEYQKARRHRTGENKIYQHGLSKMKAWQQAHKAMYRGGGKNIIEIFKIIQRVYEDNIKKFGTLTCYLCLKTIQFGQDSLEHKIPLSRGGKHEYQNLAVAHISCNHKKFNKTEAEYKGGL